MADYPSELQKYAIPSAADNRAGLKLQPARPSQQQQPAKTRAAKRPVAAPGVQQAAQQALSRMNSKPDIHQTISQVSGGTIKHGKVSPFLTGDPDYRVKPSAVSADTGFDPFEVSPADAPLADPIELQARRNVLLHELGAEPEAQIVEQDLRRPQPSLADIPLNLNPQGIAYLRRTVRVTLELKDGTFCLPVIDVKESRLSMLLLLPLHENATIFIPKPGTKLSLTFKEQSHEVYYPGTYVEVPELNTGFLSLIKADVEA